MSEKILCIAEKMSLAEAAGKVLADMRGVKPEFEWDMAKSRQYNQVGDVKFVWLDGHAFEQAMPDHYLPDDVPKTASGAKRWRIDDLPVIPKTWAIMPKEQKTRRLTMIAEDLKRCNQVWHMGDPDEEGQVLVDECLQYYGYKGPVKRVLINDYNATPVKAALANIRDNNEPMFRAWYMWGLARSRYDWLLGLNATRAMTLRGRTLGFDGLLPVGSVQTPLLYIVRERDRLIENFKPIPYYTLSAVLKHANGSFLGKWKPNEDQIGLDSEGRMIDAAIIKDLVGRLSGKDGKITAYSRVKKQQKAPLPLSMNELQMDGFSKFGYSGQQVLEAGQKLYETYKVMSYPRSDNRYLSEAKHAEAPAVMEAVFKLRPDLASLASELDVSRKSDAFNDKKMEGTPHHAIVPAIPEIPVDMAKWTEIERNIYELVVRSYLSQFAAPYEYLQTSIEADIDGETFAANGRTPVAEGWKAIYAEVEDENEEAEDDGKQTLPAMAKNDEAHCEKCDQASRKTKAPPRFDDKMLIDCMMNIHKYVTDEPARKRLKEGDGIGTTATRSPTIQDMKDRELFIPVKAGSTKLMTSQAARGLIDALPHDVKDPAQAGVFKAALDAVAKASNPNEAYKAFEVQTVEWVTRIVEQSKTATMMLPASTKAKTASISNGDTSHPCTCGKGHMRLKTGPKASFWGCSNFPECKNTQPDDNGKPGVRPAPVVQKSNPCECGGQMRQKKGPKGMFWGCSNYPQCKITLPDEKGAPGQRSAAAAATTGSAHACPKCKKDLRKLIAKKGSNAGKEFWACSGWPTCDFSASDVKGVPANV